MLEYTFVQKPIMQIFLGMIDHTATPDYSRIHALVREVDYRSMDRDEHWLVAMSSMCEVAVEVGDRDMMEYLFSALDPFSELIAIHDLLRAGSSSVASCLGNLARGLGDLETSIARYERGIEREIESDMRPGVVRSRLQLARSLLERRARGDRKRAEGLIAEAESEARRLGIALVGQHWATLEALGNRQKTQ